MDILFYIIMGLLLIAAIAVGSKLGKHVPYSRDAYTCRKQRGNK